LPAKINIKNRINMKSKMYLWGAVLLLVSVSSCKTTPSGYRQEAYEVAKAGNATNVTNRETVVTPPQTTLPSTNVTGTQGNFRVEQLTGVGVRRYSVVIGSFQNKTNAESLKNRMISNGYNALLAQNEKEMYRVIVASFDTKEEAVIARESFKQRFAPDFSDAWLLEKAY